MKKLKNTLLVVLMLLIVFVGYVLIVNRNATNMTFRQKLLKTIYPVTMWFTKSTDKSAAVQNKKMTFSKDSFYDLQAIQNNGDTLNFASLRGKKVMIVNTASNCGYTHQYEGLQKLYEKSAGNLIILAFPANDFKEQEKGTDEEIAVFCKKNYGISFPLMKKSEVIKNDEQNAVFQWLTYASKNGWNDEPPKWNFTKFLINEEGQLINYFSHSVEPESEDVVNAINSK